MKGASFHAIDKYCVKVFLKKSCKVNFTKFQNLRQIFPFKLAELISCKKIGFSAFSFHC